MLALGVMMVALGAVGLGMTYSLGAVVLFWSGILMLIAGAGHIIDAFHQTAWRSRLWELLLSAIYLFVGFMLTAMPATSAFWLTKLIALALVLSGAMRLLAMVQVEQRGLRLLLLISAVVSIGLGLHIFQLIASSDPQVIAAADAQANGARSWKWVIGLFVALELMIQGLALISISLTGRRNST